MVLQVLLGHVGTGDFDTRFYERAVQFARAIESVVDAKTTLLANGVLLHAALLLENPSRALGVGNAQLEERAVGRPQLVEADLLQEPAFVDDPDARGELLHFGQDVAGQEDRDAALLRQLLEDGADLHDTHRVEAVRGLVEDEDLGLVDECPGQSEPLLVARGERGRLARQVLDEVAHLDDLVDPAAPAQSEQVALHLDVLADCEVPVEPWCLHHRADPLERAYRVGLHALAQDLDVAVGRAHQRQHHPDRRRLARAVASQEAVHLAPPHREVEVLHRVNVLEVLGESDRAYDGLCRTRAPHGGHLPFVTDDG